MRLSVEFDADKFNQQSFNMIQQLPELISRIPEPGVYELDIFKVTVKSIEPLEDSLIKIQTQYN